MHVISRKTLQSYWATHPSVEQPLRAWLKEAEHAVWKSFVELQTWYPNASPITGNRVVFNIKGNSYRLVVKINYSTGTVFVRFIGTHAEYNRVNAEEI